MTAGCGTIVELLARVAHAGQHRGGVIVGGSDGQLTEHLWREVAARACCAADGLAQQGIGVGDRVAIAAANSLEWIVADFAIHMIGGALVPLHVGLSAEQLAWQIEHSGSRLVLNPTSLAELAASGHEIAGRAIWEATQRSVTPQTLASIVYTSGTSGEPKGVMLTQGNLAANAQQTVGAFCGRKDDCRLNSLPFSHAYGRMSDLYVSLVGNTRLALGSGRDKLIADAQRVQPTLLVVVPLQLARLRQAALAQFGPQDPNAIQKLLGGKIRGFICGGARLAEGLFDWYASQGTPVWEGYGLTEAGPIVSLSSEQACRRNSVGQEVWWTMVQIAGDGELLVSGPQVMAGYWRDEVATREVLQNGWLHTGDLAFLDEGYLVLQGRKKEFIALASGKKIWPARLEARFAEDPLIQQIMLVGEGEDSLGALVVLKSAAKEDANSTTEQQRIVEHLVQRLSDQAGHEQIRQVWILTEPWTVERGELTPKLTLRRAVILARYADCVRAMFAAPN